MLQEPHMIRTLRSLWLPTLVGVLLAAAGASSQESLPPGTKVTKIEVQPDKVELRSPFDYRQLLLTGVLDNGDRVDVTRMVKFEVPAGLVKVSERGQVRPIADGKADIAFT